MTDHPAAREMTGYLLVRGGVHILAYAKALEMATGVDVTKLFPIPRLDNKVFDTTRKWEAAGEHRRLYTFSDKDYQQIAQIWKGVHPTDGGNLRHLRDCQDIVDPYRNCRIYLKKNAPGISAEDLIQIAERLKRSAGL